MSNAPKYIGLRGIWLNRAVAFIAGTGFWLFGYDQGVMGGLLTLPTFVKTFPGMDSTSDYLSDAQKSHNSTIQGVVISIYEIGCMFGAIFCMFFGDKFGRRKMIFAGSGIMIVGAVLQASAFSLAQMSVARVVTGFGNGFITATVPMWQSECAKPETRGQLVMASGALVTCGIAFSNWIDLGFYFVNSSASWRFPIALQIVFAIFLMSIVLYLPESPRWLIKMDRFDEATNVFAALADVDIDNPYIAEEINEIKETLTLEQGMEFRKIFKKSPKKHFHRTALAIGILTLQQLGGINIVSYYAAFIYEKSVHLSALNSKIIAAVSQTQYCMAAWVPFFIIEKVGRRQLMIWGAVGLAITLGIITGTVHEADKGNSKAGVASVVFIFLYDTCFAIGWSNPPWLYAPEILSLEVRAPGSAMATASNWVFNFMVVMITPIAIDSIGAYTYLIFAALSAGLLLPCVVFFYPETTGRSLEEIDMIFEKSNGWTPWDVVKIAKELPKQHIDVLEMTSRQQRIELGLEDKPVVSHIDDAAAASSNEEVSKQE